MLPPRYRIRTKDTGTQGIKIFSEAKTKAEADTKFSEAINEDDSKQIQVEDSGRERGEFRPIAWYDPKLQSFPCWKDEK